MSIPRILIIGHFTLDSVVLHPRKFVAFDVPEGNALGATVGAAIWSNSLAVVSRIGPNYPEGPIVTLRNAGIDTNGVQRLLTPSARFWILREGEDQYQDYLFRGSDLEAMTPNIADIPLDYEGIAGVHIAPMPIERQIQFARHFKEKGSLVSLDPHPVTYSNNREEYSKLLEDVLKVVDIFSPSWHDMKMMNKHIDEMEAVREYIELGASVVALKLGERGSIVSEPKTRTTVHIPALSVEVFEESGAGDAYAGAFLASYLQNNDVVESGIAGTATASVMIEQIGMLHVLDDRERVFKRVNILREMLLH